jgi:DNA-binding beta-propeller fold protein YncE
VAETGPQTSPSSPAGVSVISTASDKVTAHLPIGGHPSQVAFSPSGATGYVITADGLWLFNTATPRPAGGTLYVTDAQQGTVAVINAATGDPDTLDTATDTTVGAVNLGGSAPQSGDGYEPTGIALTSTPTAGS